MCLKMKPTFVKVLLGNHRLPGPARKSLHPRQIHGLEDSPSSNQVALHVVAWRKGVSEDPANFKLYCTHRDRSSADNTLGRVHATV